LPLAGVEFFDGKQFRWAISPQILAEAQVQPWSTNPNQTREQLMRLSSFELHRGVEVKQVLRDQGRIVGAGTCDVANGKEQDWLADVIVGDDGVHSLVRQACGIELRTRLFPVDLVCFQADWPAGFRPDVGRIWPNLKNPESGILAVGTLPAPGPRAVGVVPVRPRIFDDLPRAQAAWRGFVEREPGLTMLIGSRQFPDDFQRVRRPWGHAPQYGGRGALLMGDAAHPVSPAGGQGANMSIADGRALAELILAGERDLLAAYDWRRRKANRRSLLFTRGAAFVLGLPEWLFCRLPASSMARLTVRRPSLIARLIRMAATAYLDP
jgi:2-polyprenyl-6-methoxyphenol hydroxylase-like FAD-dependent oxidoreductase